MGSVTRAEVEQAERALHDLLGWWFVVVRHGPDRDETLRLHALTVALARPVLAEIARAVTRALLPKRRGVVATLRAHGDAAKADRLAADLAGRDRHALDLLDVCIAAGLEQRGPVSLRETDQLRALEQLLAIRRQLATGDNPWPAGAPSVCQRCTVVFRPARRAYAEVCDYCDRHPDVPPLGHQQEHPDGRGVTIRLYAPEDAARRVLHLRRCEVCDDTFVAGSRTAIYCRDACKTAASRARRRGEAVRVPAPALSLEDREAIRAHVEAEAAEIARTVAERPPEAPGLEELGAPWSLVGFEPRSRRAA